jgi:UDP-N-acetylglucosamine acyltransferase
MSNIHPTAIIGPDVMIGDHVSVGAYSVLDGDVRVCDGTVIHPHVVLMGRTTVGPCCVVYPFASIGTQPQDLKYQGELSTVEIGGYTVMREHVTINPGTTGGGMKTCVGERCLLMVGVHIAHDCVVGNDVIMANNATLAGHVVVGDGAVIGGLAAVHQFVRIGHHAMIGGLSGVEHDVIPYGTVMGERAHLAGLNIIGMKRKGLPRHSIHALRYVVDHIFQGETLDKAIESLPQDIAGDAKVQEVLSFLRGAHKRGICTPHRPQSASTKI